jgi:hypothetical protein
MSNSNTTIDTTALRQALEQIEQAARKAMGAAGLYAVSASLNADGSIRYHVAHFEPGVFNKCTGGGGKTPEAAIGELVEEFGTPASRAAKLREEAAKKLRAAGEIEAAAVATANA